MNGVWLPKNAQAGAGLGRNFVPHRGSSGIHANNKAYGNAVSSRLGRAHNKESAQRILEGIRSDLRNGVEFWK